MLNINVFLHAQVFQDFQSASLLLISSLFFELGV